MGVDARGLKAQTVLFKQARIFMGPDSYPRELNFTN